MNGTSATIASEPAPLILVSPSQINLQVPANVPSGLQPVVVTNVNGESVAFSMPVAPVAPELYNAVVRQSNWTLVGPSNPAEPSEILLVYATGLGQTTPPLNAGVVAPSQPFSNTLPATVVVGPTDVHVYYSLLRRLLLAGVSHHRIPDAPETASRRRPLHTLTIFSPSNRDRWNAIEFD